MARRDYDENRLPLGDITKSRNQDSGSKKRARVFEDGECHGISCLKHKYFKAYFWRHISPPLIFLHIWLLDDDLRKFRRQKARERNANMPPDKKAELNAKKRENYHRKKANKQSVGSLHVAR